MGDYLPREVFLLLESKLDSSRERGGGRRKHGASGTHGKEEEIQSYWKGDW